MNVHLTRLCLTVCVVAISSACLSAISADKVKRPEKSVDSLPYQARETNLVKVGVISGSALDGNRNKIIWAVTDQHGSVRENGHLLLSQVDTDQHHPTQWPKMLAEKINAQTNNKLKAGKETNGLIIPEDSSTANALWLPVAQAEAGWKVTLHYESEEVYSRWYLNPYSETRLTWNYTSLPKKACIRVASEPNEDIGNPTTGVIMLDNLDNTSVYTLIKSMAEAINLSDKKDSIHAGEWLEGDIIAPIASSYRNRIWVDKPYTQVVKPYPCE